MQFKDKWLPVKKNRNQKFLGSVFFFNSKATINADFHLVFSGFQESLIQQGNTFLKKHFDICLLH